MFYKSAFRKLAFNKLEFCKLYSWLLLMISFHHLKNLLIEKF